MLWAAKQKKTAPLIHNNLLLKPFGILCLAAAKQRRLNNKNAERLALLLGLMGSLQSRHSYKLNAVVWSRPDTAAPSGFSASCIASACISHCWASSSTLRKQQQMWSGEQGSLLRSLHWAKAGAVLGFRTAGRLRWRAGRVKPCTVCFFKGLHQWSKSELLVWTVFVS